MHSETALTDKPMKQKKNFFTVEKKKQLWLKIAALLALGMICMTFLADWQLSRNKTQSQTIPTIQSLPNGDDPASVIERKLTSLIASLPGIKNVTVAVYFNEDSRTTYALEQESNSKTNEERGEEKSSITKEETSKIKPALANNSPLVLEQTAPKITGVAIVAGGADSALAKEQISALVTGLLDIPAHKVIIIEGKE